MGSPLYTSALSQRVRGLMDTTAFCTPTVLCQVRLLVLNLIEKATPSRTSMHFFEAWRCCLAAWGRVIGRCIFGGFT